MASIVWSPLKNAELIERYGFGFERILRALDEGGFIYIRQHPNAERYAHQKQLLVEIEGYVWIVPFVTDGRIDFWKTMFASRRATRDYLGGHQ